MTQGTRFGGAGIPWVDLNQDWLTFRGVRGVSLWNAYDDGDANVSTTLQEKGS